MQLQTVAADIGQTDLRPLHKHVRQQLCQCRIVRRRKGTPLLFLIQIKDPVPISRTRFLPTFPQILPISSTPKQRPQNAKNAGTMRVSSVLLNLMKLELHAHLLCELFDEMPDLCGVEENSVFGLPVF